MTNAETAEPRSEELRQVLSANAAIAVRRSLLFFVAGCLALIAYGHMSGNSERLWTTVFVGVLLPLWSYFELRGNRINRAFVVFGWGGFSYVIGYAFFFGGIQAPILYLLPLTIMLCAWVQGRNPAVAMSALSLGALCLLVVGQQYHWWLPVITRTPTHILIVYCSVIAMVSVTAILIAEHLKALTEHERKVSAGLKQQVVALAKSEAMLKERSAELELALVRLQESHEQLASTEAKATLSTLVASVSHELKTPIGVGVLTASSLANLAQEFAATVESGNLRRSDLSAFAARVGEGTDLVLRNMQRAEDLLLNFQQVSADQVSEQRRVFDLKTAVQEVLDILAPSLKRRQHRIVLEIASGIEMDSLPGPLGQVVINLVNNAYLHAFEGRTDGVLTINAETHGGDVTLRFRDNGVGIPQDNLARLFEPFFSTKIGKGGTGLGMAIVENLVTKALNGNISASSVVGEGTCFEVRLPRVLPVR